MLELADRLLPLLAAGERVAVATSIDVLGSAPHLVGTSMAVTADGRIEGSVSGGCVEDAALRDCRLLLMGGAASVRRFGFGDEAAARAGLACGGELDVLVHGLDADGAGRGGLLDELRRATEGLPAALALVTAGPLEVLGRVVTADSVIALADRVPGLPVALLRAAIEGRRDAGTSGAVDCCDGVLRLFVDVAAPARRMVVGGATETAAALVAAAAAIGFRVVVCDPRAAFAQPGRFPAAEAVVAAPAHEVLLSAPLGPLDAVCVLGHDEDLDPLALAVALESPAGFVGALGSRSTAARRRERLLALGVAAESVARLRSPIGLDIGASTPAEVAIAVLAEVLAVRAGRGAAPLTAGSGAIHRAPERA